MIRSWPKPFEVISEKEKKVVMLAANNDWGRGAVAAYSEEFKNLGVTLQNAEYFEQGQSDYRPSLTKVKGMNPDALLLIMESRDASVLVRQIKEIGFKPAFLPGAAWSPQSLPRRSGMIAALAKASWRRR